MNHPLIDALAVANPVSVERFTPPRPLPPLPRRRGEMLASRRRLIALVPAVAAVLALVVSLAPAGSPGGGEVLARAFAQTGGILHWRVESEPGGAYQLWMRVGANGDVVALRELRANGHESVITEPHGLGQPAGAVTRERNGRGAPIHTGRGVIYDTAFTDVVTAARRAARGALDVRQAVATTYDGRAAYAVRLPDAIGPYLGSGEATLYTVTIWVARDGGAPLAVRWAHGDQVWRTIKITTFERVLDDPRLLAFSND